MNLLPISCFIIAKDEGDRIARTIRSVRPWVKDVLVVDSHSSDDTVAVAFQEGARVIAQSWLGFGAQKRFAEDNCRYDWVLNLDADEVATPELRNQIIQLFRNGPPPLSAYGMPLDIVYPGKERPRPWARDKWYIRLYNRKVVRFRNSPVHDAVVVDGHSYGRLSAPIFHYSIRSFAHMETKLGERMALSANHSTPRSRRVTFARLFLEFPMNFAKYYVVRRHFTGGMLGMRYSYIQASARTQKIYHLWRRNRRSNPSAQRQSDEDGPGNCPCSHLIDAKCD